MSFIFGQGDWLRRSSWIALVAPRVAQPPVPGELAALNRKGKVRMGKPSILVVDDEANIRDVLQRWFESRGFDVSTASDGQEAIDLCQLRVFDVITMDLEMPRMGGVEATARVRELHPETPIVVVTGMYEGVAMAESAGATKILYKPLRLRDLDGEVQALIG